MKIRWEIVLAVVVLAFLVGYGLGDLNLELAGSQAQTAALASEGAEAVPVRPEFYYTAQGAQAMDFGQLLQSPEFLAGVVMLFFPQVFDLFEQLCIRQGWDKLISGPNRKRLLAWALAMPVALLAHLLAHWMAGVPFTLDSVQALAGLIVPLLVVSQASYLLHKQAGALISSPATGTIDATNYALSERMAVREGRDWPKAAG